ncbi:MAG: UDP-3-O-(3-hydroxymyristoyl)glucosamine N-acyltransferase [Deltaproteobacteria bacterium]|nr:UDP-3-O-(3-hydroxymyristoyl)glucosamine N-acyltransferase [Deltaproteobacteria bacterium]
MEIPLIKVAEIVTGECIGDENFVITGINSLDQAGPSEISFFSDRRYGESLKNTKAGALLVSEINDEFRGPQVVTPHVELAYSKIAVIFAMPPTRYPGISADAFIGENCRLGEDVSIFPMVYVGEDSEIDDGTTLFPGVVIDEGVKIGKRSILYPNVTVLRDCVIGNDVIVHAGATIGSDGFGFVRNGSSSVKVPQTGIVQIDDHVEIGANNCIDRAAFGKTWIKEGVKTDNLVQIAHNVVIGEHSIIVALAGISGSSQLGRGVVIGGQVGVIDHMEIGDGAMVGSQSGVAKSIPAGGVVSGTPAIDHRLWLRSTVMIARLPQFSDRLRRLEKQVRELESRMTDDGGRTTDDG